MNLSDEGLATVLRQVDAYEFEALVADLFERWDWSTTVTAGSNDRGVDVVVEKRRPFPQKYVVQVKRNGPGNTVGSAAVQQYSSLRRQEADVDGVVLVTTSSFTSQAVETADDLDVKLIDGDDLIDLLAGVDAAALLERHLDLGSATDGDTAPGWLGPRIDANADVDRAGDAVAAFDDLAGRYGRALEGPAVLNRGTQCPECSGTCYGGKIQFDRDPARCRFCIDCRTAYIEEDGRWISRQF